MSAPAPTPALARLRAQFPPPGAPRVLVHAGTCGLHAEASEVTRALVTRLPDATIAEAACDGACWAAPAATVQRQGHAHRFPHLDRGIPDTLLDCLAGRCDDEYAGRGEHGLMARLGRVDGSLGDAVANGAYLVWARAATLPPSDVASAIRTAAAGDRVGLFTVAAQWLAAPVGLSFSTRSAPGSLAARHLLQGDPHRVVEGVLIACHALDRAEVGFTIDEPHSRALFESALAQARAGGILDGSALGGPSLAIDVVGASARRVEAALPDDVQVLAALSVLFDSPPPPTRLLTFAGALPRPGVYEVPVDGAMTWAGVLAAAGAVPAAVPGLLVGGPDGALVTHDHFDDPLTAATVANGAVMVLPAGADIVELA